ncbi:MAG TPA: YdeI/OmpD-associated family protein [Opitutaceae bacterium]|nr:YdeI/OmpD-associated family protein [Opitutaceae bacterium]
MPARDPRIDDYIAKSAEFAPPILRRLRAVVHAACPEVEETIKWGMPSFLYRGKILCGIAAFKAHCTFGFWHRGMEQLIVQEIGPRAKTAMGLLGRIERCEDLPNDDDLRRFLRRAMKLIDSGAPARLPRRAPRPEAKVPADLAAALRKNKKAGAAFAAFAPSHRREYIEWITEAKRAETRAKRLATTLEWLAAGKSRNWKYENC